MKVKLNGIDRAMIPSLLPKEGDMLQQTTIKELIQMIEIKSDEYNQYDIRMEGNMMLWDTKKILAEKEYELTKPYIQILKSAVDDLNQQKKINQQILDTCLKIKNL